jgi:ligand-binding sensor domain-containing protein
MRKSEITYYLLQHFLRLRFFLFIGLINFAFLICHGQDYENGYAIKHYTIEDGLPSNTVYGVTSDRDGFLWFCTDAGVAKYDGITFKTFTTKDGLPSNEVFELFCDSKNRIWMSSFYNGVAYIMNDKVHTSDNDSVLNKVKNRHSTPKFLEDYKGNLWFRQNEYLVKLTPSNLVFETFIDLDANDGFCLYEYMNTINVMGSKAVRLNIDDLSIIHVNSNIRGLGSCGMKKLNTRIFHILSNNELVISDSTILEDNALRASSFRWNLLFADSIFWIPTSKGIKLQEQSLNVVGYLIQMDKFTYLNSDSNGNIWGCTPSNGVYKIKKKLRRRYSEFNDNCLTSVATSNRSILIGTKKDRLIVALKNLEDEKIIELNDKSVIQNGISRILVTKNGIYAAAHNKVVKYIANHLNILKPTYGAIKSIYILNNQLVVLSAGYVGFYNSISGKLVDSVSGSKRFYSYASYNNQMIFGTQDSLYYLKDKQFYPYQLNIPFDYRANDLIVKDSLLIATTIEKGIFFIHNHKVLKNINSSNGINTNTCYRSYIYKNKLYTASKKGIHVYDFATEKITHVYESDGLPSNTVFDLAIENDTLYAATEKGLCILPISSIKQNRTFPFFIKPIYKANDTTWDLPPIIQTHTDTSLTFVLNALNFNVKGGVTYYYRIKEIDTSYTHSIDKNVTIKIEKPGEYIFEAFALNTEGTKSNVKILHVCVEPYFYQTIWFKVLVFSVIIAFIILLVYYFVQRAKKKQIEKAELDAKIRNLELSAWKSAINPHFLFNSLNTMQGLFHLNDFKKANSYVTEFSGILRKTIDHSGRLLIKLDDEVKYLNNYLELEKIKRSDSFTYDVKYDSPKLLQYYIPSLLIQPVIENSIKHAIRDGINGYIKINFALQNNTVECVISDNGGGFPKEAVQKDYVSKGLRLIKSKINIVERLTNSSIHFSYKNRYNNSNEIVGAETTFYFPLLTIDYDSGLMD